MWQSACADGSGHAGWIQAEASEGFSTRDSESTTITEIDHVLSGQGWTRHDLVITRGQGPVPQWTRTVNGNKRLRAFAYAVPAGSDQWFMTASWQPTPAVDAGDCA
jgi:hypothetical protein